MVPLPESLAGAVLAAVSHSTRFFGNLTSSDCNSRRTMFEGLFQPMHLLVIFGVALLVFGPKKPSRAWQRNWRGYPRL